MCLYQTHADVLVLIMTLWLLKGPPGAYSATAITSLIAGLAALAGLLRIKKLGTNLGANTLTAIMALVISFGVLTFFAGGSTVGALTSSLGRDETLTGRTEIWAELLPVVIQNPFLGSGFGAFWTPKAIDLYRIGEAHNGYLEVLLELGFVGLLLFSMFLLSCCRKAQRALGHNYDWGSLWICFLLMALIHNISETSINSFTTQLTAVLLFLAVSSTGDTEYV